VTFPIENRAENLQERKSRQEDQRIGPLETWHFAFGDNRGAYDFVGREEERSMKIFVDL